MSDHKFTADLHLGHEFVAKERGFRSTGEHDERIISGLQKAVRKHDTLWILGDYSMSMHRYARRLLASLPCRKNLIPGNHDPEHPMHRGAPNAQRPLEYDIFSAVVPYQRIRLQKINFLMSHLPYIGGGDHKPEERHAQYRLPNEGMPLLCGHVHDAWKFNGNQFNVGVDVNDFQPVSAQTVIDWWKVENDGN